MTRSELENYFSKRLRKKVTIIFTNNRVRLASYKKGLRSVALRLHNHFAFADDDQLEELVKWIKDPRKKPTFIKEFATNLHINHPALRVYDRPVGNVFNLNLFLNKVINEYFPNEKLDFVTISWGRKSPKKRVRSRKLGSYRHDSKQIIIHPILDDKRVPNYVLEFLVYHELLHALQPKNIQRPHDRTFRDKEKLFPRYDEAVEWQENSEWIMH